MRDGSVVTWGNAGRGGDNSAVETELKQGVDTIYGSVITWGEVMPGVEIAVLCKLN
jgi:hypothetical protein